MRSPIQPAATRVRRGSVFAVVLLVLLVMTVVVGSLQYLTLTSAKHTRIAMRGDDTLYRADGLLHLLISRWKKEVRYQVAQPLTSLAAGSEGGNWDGREYVLGWQRRALPTQPPTYRMMVWVHFPEERPARTYRYDLRLRTPSALDPRLLDISGIAQDGTDPRTPGALESAFATATATESAGTRLEREARVEAFTSRISALAARGTAPADLIDGTRNIETTTMSGILDRMDEFAGRAPSGAGAQLTRGQELTRLATQLPPGERRIWEDFGRFVTAEELVSQAERTTGTRAEGIRRQAMDLLEAIIRDGDCCGEPRVALRLAGLKLELRRNVGNALALAAARRAATEDLTAVMLRKPGGFVHPRTDIIRDELPAYFNRAWRARVAAGVRAGPDRHMLVSVLDNGTDPIIHLESVLPIRPLLWKSDGGEMVVASGDPPDTSLWLLKIDGSRLYALSSDPGSVSRFGEGFRWSSVDSIQESALGGVCVITGNAEGQLVGSNSQLLTLASDGDARVSLSGMLCPGTSGGCGLPTAVSPDGERLAVLVGTRTKKLWLGSCSELLEGGDRLAIADEDAPSTDPAAQTGVIEPVPRLSFPAGTGVTGLSWGRPGGQDVIALTTVSGGRSGVMFADLAAARPGAAPSVSRISTAVVDVPATAPLTGRFLTSPPGYVLSTGAELRFVPRPGVAAPTVPSWSSPGVPMQNIANLEASPWGGKVYFVTGPPDARRVIAMDPASGTGRVLAGPGGAFPDAVSADRLAVAPIPVEAP